MSWLPERARLAPLVDWRRAIEELLRDHAPEGSRCRASGRLPEGMDPVLHQATAVFNRLVQAGVVSAYERPPEPPSA